MASHRESGERSDAVREKQGSGLWTPILALAGLVMVSGGGILALAPQLGSEVSWVAEKMAHGGPHSGAVAAGGIVLLGLAIVCAGQSRVLRGSCSLSRLAAELSELRKGQKRLADRFGTLHLEMSVLQEANKTLLRAAQDQSAVQAAGMQVDATYRLAASMDQLGARLEGRLEDQRSDLESRLGDLSGSLRETRDHVEQWLHRNLSAVDPSEEKLGENEQEEEEEDREPGMTLERFGSGLDEELLDLNAPARLPEHDDDFEELEVLVTLEEEGEEADSPYHDLRPWGALEPDEEVLLELEEELEALAFEAGDEDAEEETTAKITGATEDAGAEEEVELGLLDVLDEDGSLIEGREPPPATASLPAPVPTGVERAKVGKALDEPSPPSLIRRELTDEVLKEALDTVKRRRRGL